MFTQTWIPAIKIAAVLKGKQETKTDQVGIPDFSYQVSRLSLP